MWDLAAPNWAAPSIPVSCEGKEESPRQILHSTVSPSVLRVASLCDRRADLYIYTYKTPFIPGPLPLLTAAAVPSQRKQPTDVSWWLPVYLIWSRDLFHRQLLQPLIIFVEYQFSVSCVHTECLERCNARRLLNNLLLTCFTHRNSLHKRDVLANKIFRR